MNEGETCTTPWSQNSKRMRSAQIWKINIWYASEMGRCSQRNPRHIVQISWTLPSHSHKGKQRIVYTFTTPTYEPDSLADIPSARHRRHTPFQYLLNTPTYEPLSDRIDSHMSDLHRHRDCRPNTNTKRIHGKHTSRLPRDLRHSVRTRVLDSSQPREGDHPINDALKNLSWEGEKESQ